MPCVMQSEQHLLPMAEDIDGSMVQGLAIGGQRRLELELLLVAIAEHLAQGGVLGEGGIETLGEGLVELLVADHFGQPLLPLLGQGLEQGEFGRAAGAVAGVGFQSCGD